MRRTLGLGLSLLIAVMLSLACEPEVSRTEQDRSPAARHAVHSEQLQDIMAGMGQEVRQTWPQEIAPLKQQQQQHDNPQRFDRIAETAGRIANSAHAIPQAIPEDVLAGTRRQTFLQLVARLESQARGVEKNAAAHDRSAMDAELRQMRETCNSCHQQFREVAGPLPWGS